jgi:hypothetical protein
MVENPYESAKATSSTPKKRATRWLVWSGIVSLTLAATCVVITVVGMMLTFNSIATSATPPKPSDFAHGISVASLPLLAVVPLGILGIVLLVTGFIVRQPVDRP